MWSIWDWDLKSDFKMEFPISSMNQYLMTEISRFSRHLNIYLALPVWSKRHLTQTAQNKMWQPLCYLLDWLGLLRQSTLTMEQFFPYAEENQTSSGYTLLSMFLSLQFCLICFTWNIIFFNSTELSGRSLFCPKRQNLITNLKSSNTEEWY